MKKLNKKGAFETINAGMLTFLSFVLISVLVILTLSVVNQTKLVCEDNYNNGACFACNNVSYTRFNASDNRCYNTSASGAADPDYISSEESGTAAYNGTKDMREAALLPPQFAQIIVITLIIVGIIGMLAALGFGVYQRMRR